MSVHVHTVVHFCVLDYVHTIFHSLRKGVFITTGYPRDNPRNQTQVMFPVNTFPCMSTTLTVHTKQ